jgi:hypothetical protein
LSSYKSEQNVANAREEASEAAHEIDWKMMEGGKLR